MFCELIKIDLAKDPIPKHPFSTSSLANRTRDYFKASVMC